MNRSITAEIPQEFIRWVYKERASLIRRQAQGERVPPQEIFLGFSRHTPAIVSHGPAGLNASIKGVGFLPKTQYLEETLEAYMAQIQKGWHDRYSDQGLRLMMEYIYGEQCHDRLDFTRLGTLELAHGHTWQNLRVDPTVTLLFYQPPLLSFEVRAKAEIHESGIYHRLLNAQHDVYHEPHPERWKDRPAYVFIIEEIYNNSANDQGFGKRIY